METIRSQGTAQIDPPVRRRILAAVENRGDQPRPDGSVMLTGSPGWQRIRVGGYRVVYDIRDDAPVLLVLPVGTRGGVYRRLPG